MTLDEYEKLVGTEIGVSSWITVDQAMIDAYADVIGDHQFIHVDPEKARATPFGGTIAHGLLTLSLLPRMAYEVLPVEDGARMGVNYGYDRVRFIAPVKSGKRVRGRFVLSGFDRRPGQVVKTMRVTVEIEGEDKPALAADWIGMTFL